MWFQTSAVQSSKILAEINFKYSTNETVRCICSRTSFSKNIGSNFYDIKYDMDATENHAAMVDEGTKNEETVSIGSSTHVYFDEEGNFIEQLKIADQSSVGSAIKQCEVEAIENTCSSNSVEVEYPSNGNKYGQDNDNTCNDLDFDVIFEKIKKSSSENFSRTEIFNVDPSVNKKWKSTSSNITDISNILSTLGYAYDFNLNSCKNGNIYLENISWKAFRVRRLNRGLTLQKYSQNIFVEVNQQKNAESSDSSYYSLKDDAAASNKKEENQIPQVAENICNFYISTTRSDNSSRQFVYDRPNTYFEEVQSDFYTADDTVDKNNLSANGTIDIKERKRTKSKKRKNKRKTTKSNYWWLNRYNLFEKFDDGIKLDEESWYSVTPEKMAEYIAERCRSDMIIDGFCGAGGNTIQFAFTCERVIAIDKDPIKIQLAKNNAEVYGVADRIEFIIGDFFQLAPMLKADAIFLSPPWGGPQYKEEESFSLDLVLSDYGGGKYLFDIAKHISENVAYYLPRNICVNEIFDLSRESDVVEIEQFVMDKRLKVIVAYFGTLRQYTKFDDNIDL